MPKSTVKKQDVFYLLYSGRVSFHWDDKKLDDPHTDFGNVRNNKTVIISTTKNKTLEELFDTIIHELLHILIPGTHKEDHDEIVRLSTKVLNDMTMKERIEFMTHVWCSTRSVQL